RYRIVDEGVWRARGRDARETARVLASNPKPVKIVALAATFHVSGQPAEVGARYTMDADIAQGLVHLGKARFA
ncbi:MAG: hypothetical protein ACT4UQ_09325, partial [Gammaproteobacteria bacterium]